ncbi:MAG: hypothetical protein Q8K18_00405 [Burkholderiales bacterium]|nr:hypothetical protein [Burkholderiales bacterium]
MGHWSLLLLPLLVAYRSPTFFDFGISFNAQYLLVPLAALLAQRFGLTGVISIAVGGIVFVIGLSGGAWGALGGNPALYLVALAVAAIVASPHPLSKWLEWPGSERAANWLTFAAPFLLVAGFAIRGGSPLSGGLRLDFGFSFALLGYFLLFVMGARGVRVALLIAGLIGAAAMTWGLALGDLLPRARGPFYIWINALQPAVALTALVAFAAGAAMTAVLEGRPLQRVWRWPYLTVAALLVLWFGPNAVSAIPIRLPGVWAVYLLQSAVVLPFAGFMAGMLRGARGAFFVSASALVYMVLWALGALVAQEAADITIRVRYFPLEAPFVAMAFAVLGAKIAETRQEPASFGVLRIPAFILLMIATGFAIVGEGGTARLVLGGIFVAGSCAIFIAAIRLRRSMAGTVFETTAERWMGFTTILFLALAILANLEATGDVLRNSAFLLLPLQALWDAEAGAQLRRMVGEQPDFETLAGFGIMLAIYLGGLYAAGRTLWRTIPKIYQDGGRIVGFVREWRARRAGAAKQ